MKKRELQEKARQLGIFGFWFMNNGQLLRAIKKAEKMTIEEIKNFDWVSFIMYQEA